MADRAFSDDRIIESEQYFQPLLRKSGQCKRIKYLTREQKLAIDYYRQFHLTHKTIRRIMGLSEQIVSAHCYEHELPYTPCLYCGKKIPGTKGGKLIKYCSKTCRDKFFANRWKMKTHSVGRAPEMTITMPEQLYYAVELRDHGVLQEDLIACLVFRPTTKTVFSEEAFIAGVRTECPHMTEWLLRHRLPAVWARCVQNRILVKGTCHGMPGCSGQFHDLLDVFVFTPILPDGSNVFRCETIWNTSNLLTFRFAGVFRYQLQPFVIKPGEPDTRLPEYFCQGTVIAAILLCDLGVHLTTEHSTAEEVIVPGLQMGNGVIKRRTSVEQGRDPSVIGMDQVAGILKCIVVNAGAGLDNIRIVLLVVQFSKYPIPFFADLNYLIAGAEFVFIPHPAP